MKAGARIDQNVGWEPKKVSRLQTINKQIGIAVSWPAGLFLLCFSVHRVALLRMAIVDRQFPITNERTVRNMALIDFIDQNHVFVMFYFGLFVASLFYLAARNCPPWSLWTTQIIFAVPCLIYLRVCGYIGNKFVF